MKIFALIQALQDIASRLGNVDVAVTETTGVTRTDINVHADVIFGTNICFLQVKSTTPVKS